jgi:hypothetical protein
LRKKHSKPGMLLFFLYLLLFLLLCEWLSNYCGFFLCVSLKRLFLYPWFLLFSFCVFSFYSQYFINS